MKTKIALLLSALLLVGTLCGCGVQPAPAGDSTATAVNAEPAASSTQKETQAGTTAKAPDDSKELKLYADYLTDGGYGELLTDYDDPEAEYEAEACLFDVNDDGVRELLIHFTNKAWSGVRGYPSVTALLGVRDGKAERLGFAENAGGSGGGDYLLIRYDTLTEKHVLEYEEYVRDGLFFNTYALHFFDVNRRDAKDKELGLTGAGSVVFKTAHTLRCNTYYSEGAYAEDAERVLNETDLCKQEEGFVTAYLYDDEYVSEAEYDKITARFVEPTDPAYRMKPVTFENPIPD